jgi:hypothetical protein
MLALENGRILPNINFSKPNPKSKYQKPCGLDPVLTEVQFLSKSVA